MNLIKEILMQKGCKLDTNYSTKPKQEHGQPEEKGEVVHVDNEISIAELPNQQKTQNEIVLNQQENADEDDINEYDFENDIEKAIKDCFEQININLKKESITRKIRKDEKFENNGFKFKNEQ